jgi:hypothetical protein
VVSLVGIDASVAVSRPFAIGEMALMDQVICHTESGKPRRYGPMWVRHALPVCDLLRPMTACPLLSIIVLCAGASSLASISGLRLNACAASGDRKVVGGLPIALA